jgi:hypothetical protein
MTPSTVYLSGETYWSSAGDTFYMQGAQRTQICVDLTATAFWPMDTGSLAMVPQRQPALETGTAQQSLANHHANPVRLRQPTCRHATRLMVAEPSPPSRAMHVLLWRQ